MEKKFTPGPWEVGINGFGNPDYIYCDDQAGSAIAHCAFEFSFLSSEEIEANKKLIAAAPDMLEALENLIEKCLRTADTTLMHEELYNAQQAIKKATE